MENIMSKNCKKEKALALWPVEKAIRHIIDRCVVSETGCWEYQGSRTKDGYGQIGIAALLNAYGIKCTHRLMYHLATGHVFAGRHEQVLHACDNPRCCNPDHLSVGTALHNMTDAWQKGRMPKGEAHRRSILKEENVREIRELAAKGYRTCEITKMFPHATYSAVWSVVRGLNWQHVH
jgi:hypothetical protein